MSKALEEIKTLRGFNQVELNNDENINKSLDIIENKLKVLEKIQTIMDTWHTSYIMDNEGALRQIDKIISEVKE